MTWAGPPAARWRGQWIWADDSNVQEGARRSVALRRTFDLAEVPASAPARVFADSRYVLCVNGVELARGPVRVDARRSRYDIVDLQPYLSPGRNVVAALVCFYGSPTSWWVPAPTRASAIDSGGFLFEADMGDAGWVVSDASWRVRLLEGWTSRVVEEGSTVDHRPHEVIDLRSLPADWQRAEFDDGGWDAPVVLRAASAGEPGNPNPPSFPHGPYGPRPIGWPAVERVPLTPDKNGAFVAPEVVAGTIEIDVEGPTGVEVSFTAAEYLEPDGSISANQPTFGAAFVLDGTRRRVETFDSYGLSGLRFAAPDDVTVHATAVTERLYPVAGEAAFECSDSMLNSLWQAGRRTVTLCSFDAYVDCPTREQRAWTGDAVVHQLVDLTTNADWRLARWNPLMCSGPRPDGMLPMAAACDLEPLDVTVIPDWALHWVHSVSNLHRYVGDRDEIQRLLPSVEGVLRWFDPFVDGGVLTDVVGYVIVDWASVYTEGVSSVLNGLWGRSLLEFAAMAAWVGDAGRAGWARQAHDRLRRGFERLWDPDRLRYADCIAGGVLRPMASQHGQAAAIVGGLAPPERHPRLVEVMTDAGALVHATFGIPDGEATPNSGTMPGGGYVYTGHPAPWWDVDRLVVRAQPFFRYVVHDALFEAGRADLIPAQCRDWSMALERCGSSLAETWFGGTVSHGWSATPTRDLMTRVLGVEPAEPGFSLARVDPALGDLAWARGAVPCPTGYIKVDVGGRELRVESPVPFLHDGVRYEPGTHELGSSDGRNRTSRPLPAER